MTLRNPLRAPLAAVVLTTLVGGLLTLAPAGAHAADKPRTPTKASVVGQQQTTTGKPSKADGLTQSEARFPRSSYLCYGYKACNAAGMSASGYAANNDKMYWRMYSGHNCTNYAAYRMVKSGLPNVRPWSGGGNATYWGTSVPKLTNGTPTVGAVAWWKANHGPAGSAGHVAYVERVVSSTEIVVSQDSWGGDFSWATITKASGNWPSGFVHFNDVQLLNKGLPTISGMVKVGSTLTASKGTWSPTDAKVAYQWYAGGVAIAGATKATYVPTASQLGKALVVRTTGSKSGYAARTVQSAATAAVLPGVISSTTPTTLTGTAKVGYKLTVRPGTWSPSGLTLSIQWYVDGAPIDGATGTVLAITPELANRQVNAVVTANRSGYTAVTAPSPSRLVALGTIKLTGSAALRGVPKPGQTLTATAPRHSPADAVVTYQWLRNGQPVEGATAATYPVSYADLGARISSQVSLTRDGYAPVVQATPASAVVRSTPKLRIIRDTSHPKLRVRIRVIAPGVAEPTGKVRVRIPGYGKQVITLRHGIARVSLRGVAKGRYTLAIYYRGSQTVESYLRSGTIRIR